jgi:hypothetical protein
MKVQHAGVVLKCGGVVQDVAWTCSVQRWLLNVEFEIAWSGGGGWVKCE